MKEILVCPGCDNKNAINGVVYKPQKWISPSSGGWEDQARDAGRFGVH